MEQNYSLLSCNDQVEDHLLGELGCEATLQKKSQEVPPVLGGQRILCSPRPFGHHWILPFLRGMWTVHIMSIGSPAGWVRARISRVDIHHYPNNFSAGLKRLQSSFLLAQGVQSLSQRGVSDIPRIPNTPWHCKG